MQRSRKIKIFVKNRSHGTRADCTQASALIDGLKGDSLLADRAYDTQEILDQANSQDMKLALPPKKNRKQQRDYDKHPYKIRHLVEKAFLQLKRWRGIATRYAKNTHSLPLCKLGDDALG